nr:energy transducer TonB [Sphingomonas laterariae]
MTFARTSFCDRAGGFLASLALHVALGVALFAWPLAGSDADRPTVARGEHVLVVELLPLPAGGTTGKPGVADVARKEADRKGTTATAAGRTGPEQSGRFTGSGQPAGGTMEAQGPGNSNAASPVDGAPAMSGAEVLLFKAKLQRHIERYRRYPPQARQADIEGIAQVHFVMDHDGKVVDIWIEISSGSKLLDDEAVAAVMRAQRLPTPPAGWPSTFGVTLPIGFSLE